MNTENVQQDGGEETQIPEDGIRNFEDKTPWNVLLNTIYSQNKDDMLRISAFWKTHSRNVNWFQIKLETVWLPTHNSL